VRVAVERAWFEQQPVRVTHVDSNFVQKTYEIQVMSIIMERHETRIDAVFVDGGERRHFRLDRIMHAEVLPRGQQT
jgi:hypothetical protein